jgi:hypothetical protein
VVGPIGTAVVGACALAVLALVVTAYRKRRTA